MNHEAIWESSATDMEQDLLPGLPDNLVLELILTRVSWLQMVPLASVSRSWRAAVRGRKIYGERIRTGSTRMLIAINQLVQGKSAADIRHPRLYPGGEDDLYAISLYDVSACLWKRLPPIPGLRYGLPHGYGRAFLKGKLFIIGGEDPVTRVSSADVYLIDLGAGQLVWQKCARMIHSRESFACSVVDGKVYVAGGHTFPVSQFDDDWSIIHHAEVYDPEENVWHALPDMSFDWLEDCRELCLREQLFVVLGIIDDQPESAFLYDPIKGFWSSDESLVEPYLAFGWEFPTYFELGGEYFSLRDTEALLFDKSKQIWEPLQYSDGTSFNTQQQVDTAVGTPDGEVIARVEVEVEPRVPRGHGPSALMKSKGFQGFMHGNNKLEWEEVPYPTEQHHLFCYALWSFIM